MKNLLHMAVALFIAAVFGLGSVWLTIQDSAGVEQIRKGPWISWIAAGDPNADPYTHAMLARTGRIPLAAAEAIYFHASTDNDGNPLSSNCTFRIQSQPLDTRMWTLTATDGGGRFIENPAARYSYNSLSILREPDGGFIVRVGPKARAGNWIPAGTNNQIVMTLRLYDTSLKTNGGLADPILPAIIREDCQ